jgi:hypothetical protein
MNTTQQKRFYSPQFSEAAAVAVRRLAWAMGGNMGQAVNVMVSCLPGFINSGKVCAACKDTSKCAACVFKTGGTLPEKAAKLLYS